MVRCCREIHLRGRYCYDATVEFVTMNEQSANPPQLPKPTYAGPLVFGCLIIGVLASLYVVQSTRNKAQQNRLTALRTSAVKIQGDAEDMGKLLSDPRTQWVRLSGSLQASLAWNE